MRLGRSKRFTIQMREYETYSFGADVSLDHHDLGYSDDELANMPESDYAALRENLTAAVLDELYVQLDEEIRLTAELVEDRHSFIRRARRLVELMEGDATTALPTTTKPATAKLITRRS